MLLKVKISDNLSFSAPVDQTLDVASRKFRLRMDRNSASLVKPGQSATLFDTKNDKIFSVKSGSIASVVEIENGIVVTL